MPGYKIVGLSPDTFLFFSPQGDWCCKLRVHTKRNSLWPSSGRKFHSRKCAQKCQQEVLLEGELFFSEASLSVKGEKKKDREKKTHKRTGYFLFHWLTSWVTWWVLMWQKNAELECSVLRTTACVGGSGWLREWRFISSCVILFWLCYFWTLRKGEWFGTQSWGWCLLTWEDVTRVCHKFWLFETTGFNTVTKPLPVRHEVHSCSLFCLWLSAVAYRMSSWWKCQIILVQSKPWP